MSDGRLGSSADFIPLGHESLRGDAPPTPVRVEDPKESGRLYPVSAYGERIAKPRGGVNTEEYDLSRPSPVSPHCCWKAITPAQRS